MRGKKRKGIRGGGTSLRFGGRQSRHPSVAARPHPSLRSGPLLRRWRALPLQRWRVVGVAPGTIVLLRCNEWSQLNPTASGRRRVVTQQPQLLWCHLYDKAVSVALRQLDLECTNRQGGTGRLKPPREGNKSQQVTLKAKPQPAESWFLNQSKEML